jgi:hypothetical protein
MKRPPHKPGLRPREPKKRSAELTRLDGREFIQS